MTTVDQDTLAGLVRDSVEMSLRHVDAGGIPFTALVADRHGRVLGSGVNRVAEDSDPTAHAEVVAIREATRGLGAPTLGGATLIASGEPCGMCYVAALFAGLRRVVYAVDRDGAARAGFDYRGTYDLFARDPRQWPFEVRHVEVDGAARPFDAWLQRRGR
jgi:guanine deaminase